MHPSHRSTRSTRTSFARALAAAALATLPFAAPAGAQQVALLAALPLPARHAPASPVEALRAKHLLIPVQGVRPEQLRDTYREARSGGRVHDAIDIPAPHLTPVLAATDGMILKLHQGALGGNSIYQLDPDGRTRYYYAHLDHYADGIEQGVHVHRGQVIGYVGDTGNAQPGDWHLHFSIALLDDVSRWWEGQNVNPYDVLRYPEE
jgi:murein DD-endopeptidase MepM/ murein hydrolase activator NlpD